MYFSPEYQDYSLLSIGKYFKMEGNTGRTAGFRTANHIFFVSRFFISDIQSWFEVPSIAHFCSLFRAAFSLVDFDIEVSGSGM